MVTKSTAKFVWITGASRGIGLSTAQLFLQEGWNVVIITRNVEALMNLKHNHPDALHTFSIDLEQLENEELPDFPVDVLINNAGAILNQSFDSIQMKDLERVYRVNVFAPFQLTQKLLGQFRKNAHIVNISSIGGVQGSVKFPGLSAYSSSKGALTILTECLQAEFSDSSFAFNCLALGAVNTTMLSEAFPGYQAPIDPDQIAAYILGFATTAHKVMKGKTIEVSLSTP